MKKNIKPTLAAILFFAVMALVGIGSAQAQINLLEQTHIVDTNPLLATTGPNTVGAGHLMLSASADWSHLHFSNDQYLYWDNSMPEDLPGILMSNSNRYNTFTGNVGLRYGIGNAFEVNAAFGGGLSSDNVVVTTSGHDTSIHDLQHRLSYALGAKIRFYEGHDWVPQMALAAQVAETFTRHEDSHGFDAHNLSWGIALQMRNRLSQRWLIDYRLGIASREHSLGLGQRQVAGFSYSIMARFLASNRLMLSAGLDNGNGLFEALYQATPRLQLTTQALVATGIGGGMLTSAGYIMAGASWMLR